MARKRDVLKLAADYRASRHSRSEVLKRTIAARNALNSAIEQLKDETPGGYATAAVLIEAAFEHSLFYAAMSLARAEFGVPREYGY